MIFLLLLLLLVNFISMAQGLSHSFFSGEIVKIQDKTYYIPYGTEAYSCSEVTEYIVNGFSDFSTDCKDNRMAILDSALLEQRTILKCDVNPETCYPGNLNIEFNYSVRKMESEKDTLYATKEGIILDYLPTITKDGALLDAFSRMSGNPVYKCRHTNTNIDVIDEYGHYMVKNFDINLIQSLANNVPYYISFPSDFIGGTIYVRASYASLSSFPDPSEITEEEKDYKFLVVANDKLYMASYVDEYGASGFIDIRFEEMKNDKNINFYQKKPIYKDKSIDCDDNLTCIYPVFYQYLVDFQSAILEKRLCQFEINGKVEVYDCGGVINTQKLEIRDDDLKCNLCIKGNCQIVDYPVEIDTSTCYDYTIDCTGYITFYSNSCFLFDDDDYSDFEENKQPDSNREDEYVVIPVGIECGFSMVNMDPRCKEYWSEVLTWTIISVFIIGIIALIVIIVLIKLKILKCKHCRKRHESKNQGNTSNDHLCKEDSNDKRKDDSGSFQNSTSDSEIADNSIDDTTIKTSSSDSSISSYI